MYGFEAITANNGWSMAIVGASIDFTGLVILSIIISQLHKLLEYWDNRKSRGNESEASLLPADHKMTKGNAIPDIFPQDILEVAKLYGPLIEKIGKSFQLTELYRIAQENKYPHPHLTITSFRQEGILVSEGDGLFSWNQ